jgi:hypothetical protein
MDLESLVLQIGTHGLTALNSQGLFNPNYLPYG